MLFNKQPPPLPRGPYYSCRICLKHPLSPKDPGDSYVALFEKPRTLVIGPCKENGLTPLTIERDGSLKLDGFVDGSLVWIQKSFKPGRTWHPISKPILDRTISFKSVKVKDGPAEMGRITLLSLDGDTITLSALSADIYEAKRLTRRAQELRPRRWSIASK